MGHMVKPRGIRRFLRFTLRSLLLLTLVVAVWLGYEARQARRTEGHRRSIESLGGSVETEPEGLSLLRFLVAGDFGQEVVAAKIPGPSVGKAIGTLAAIPYLRRVRVLYDGTCDIHPDWERLNVAFPTKIVEAVGDVDYHGGLYGSDPSDAQLAMLNRFSTKMEQGPAKVQQLLQDLKRVSTPPDRWHKLCRTISYRSRQLGDGTVAELLSGSMQGLSILGFNSSGSDSSFAILLVGDRAIDGASVDFQMAQGSQEVQLLAVSGNDAVAVGFEYHSPGAAWIVDKRARQFASDPRQWFGLYRIEADGFKSLLPEEPLPRPAGDKLANDLQKAANDAQCALPDVEIQTREFDENARDPADAGGGRGARMVHP